jgi:hypothetical protein
MRGNLGSEVEKWDCGQEERLTEARHLAQNSRKLVELLTTDLADFRNEERASHEAVIAAVHSIEGSQRLSLDSTESLQSRQMEERNERLRREEERKFGLHPRVQLDPLRLDRADDRHIL